MAIYAVALGCYTALMLLVVSMEEGGDNLTVGTTSLTQAVVLLSEGSGFRTDSFTLTITPLLLTILLIWLINALIMRIKAYGPHCVCCRIDCLARVERGIPAIRAPRSCR